MQADGKMSGSFCTCSWKSVLTFDKDVICKNLSLFKLLVLFLGLIWMSSVSHSYQLILNSVSGPCGVGIRICGSLGKMGSDKETWGIDLVYEFILALPTHKNSNNIPHIKSQPPCHPAIKLSTKMSSCSHPSQRLFMGILL